MRKRKDFGFSIVGFLLFFLTIAFTSTCSIFVYYLVNKATNGNIWAVGFSVLATIGIGAVICSLFDILRRKKMIEKPLKKILEATEKISSGDFSIKLEHSHAYSKYDEYDLIFDNINTMTAELSKNEILKTDFISNVSHEIKTPLAVIQNYAKSLKNNKIEDEKREELVDGLIFQTKKLSDLVSNILKLNKLENQKIMPEIEEFDLSELLRCCAIEFESLIEKKSLNLECDIDEVRISSSVVMLEIAINNLISNAIKFTESGGKIGIKLKEEDRKVIIQVEDSGCGISKEVGEHMFDKFYQGDTSRSEQGNGLGLALVKKVIDLLGGEISVESKLGRGSTFTLKLKKN